MSRFQPKTFKTWQKILTAAVVARSELTDLEVGGGVHTVVSAVARAADTLSFDMIQLQRIWDIDTAADEDLDDRIEDFPLDFERRRPASKATGGAQTFTRTGTLGNQTIPAGTRVSVPDGPEFTTNSDVVIADGSSTSAPVSITAVVAGEAGNVDAGTITRVQGVVGVSSTTNGSGTSGGQPRETNAELRARAKAWIRSLGRGTVEALRGAVLNVTSGGKRVTSAEIVEGTGTELGTVWVYVDDGSGTAEESDDNYGSAETVVLSASGGEDRFYLDNVPVKSGTSLIVKINSTTLTEGTDFTINRATGQIDLDSTVYPTGLTAADSVTAEYTWYEGLIAEAQKTVDGDASDRANYPGYRAAGTLVYVVPPTVLQQIIRAVVIPDDGFSGAAVRTNVAQAIARYINSLPINGDIIFSELIYHAQSVRGVADINFTTPTATVVIGPDEIARVLIDNIDLS